jgi:hypothetical protein
VTYVSIGILNNQTYAPEALYLTDDNKAPSNGTQTRIRFVHASPTSPQVDVRLNGQLIFSDIKYGGNNNHVY